MLIAVIEDNESLKKRLHGLLEKEGWKVDFFQSSSDFGKARLHRYDAILADQTLEPVNGRQLLYSISKKTKAELLLMNDGPFKDDDAQSEHIKGLIDKSSIEDVMDKLHYINSKLRIQKLAQEERKRLESITSVQYDIGTQDGVSIVELNDMSDDVVNRVKEALLKDNKNIVLTFPFHEELSSTHLGVIASIYNILKKKDRRIVFWNKFQSKNITKIFELCRLEVLVPVFDDLNEALSFLKS
jgi:CheY-like chemotaxis protein